MLQEREETLFSLLLRDWCHKNGFLKIRGRGSEVVGVGDTWLLGHLRVSEVAAGARALDPCEACHRLTLIAAVPESQSCAEP